MKLQKQYMEEPVSEERVIRTGIWYLAWRWIAIVCLTVTIHIMMSSWYWPDKHEHVHKILLSDMQILQTIDYSHTAYHRATAWAKDAFYWVFEASGFNGMIRAFSTPTGFNPPDTEVRKVIVHFWSEIQASMYSVQIIGERSSVLFSTWPLVFIVSLIAVADGWSSRWLRRAHGGRESAFLYHRLKRGIFLSIVLMWASYLLWPSTVDPRLVILPFLMLYALTLRFTISYFKKYF